MFSLPTFNEGQNLVGGTIFEFLLNPTAKQLSISGPAGVGKTYLLQMIISHILPMYRDACKMMNIRETIKEVELTATTNKAAEVLAGSVNLPTRTIHSLMHLKVTPDYNTGKERIERKNSFMIHHNTLIFIDEASMISRELYDIIQEATHSSCKIIYIGDDKQLSPVGEKISPVYSDPNVIHTFLTQPVRNAGQPALMNLCNQLRHTVDTGIFKPITLVPGVIDLLSDAEMNTHVDTFFKQEGYDSRILGYTNNQVQQYNAYIRSIRGYNEYLQDGELVVNNQSIELGGDRGTIGAEKEFIVEIPKEPLHTTIEIGGFEIEAYWITLKASNSELRYKVLQTKDKDFLQQVSKYLSKNKEWRFFYKLKNSFPDLRSRDASTTHKSQGSTFDSVYIDLQNIGTCNIPDQVARMLYVAASRARNRVYLYGSLPAKYHGG